MSLYHSQSLTQSASKVQVHVHFFSHRHHSFISLLQPVTTLPTPQVLQYNIIKHYDKQSLTFE